MIASMPIGIEEYRSRKEHTMERFIAGLVKDLLTDG
jgi:hypothetical protein